mmetsp:Transcript_5728/g.16067  ORF Transcript_5728/g.16067 Transcript_5728/m.16067 type:complete len:103 (-) Transcript_5728:610-918(-)
MNRGRGEVRVEIFAAGDGINYPRAGQTVTVHYTGYLSDGTQFDSSRDRGKPFKFKLGCEQVVPGLDEGVSQLSIGERAKIMIPAGTYHHTTAESHPFPDNIL